MQLRVLIDNNTYIDQYFYGEPAVSYYMEDGDRRILFDTGYSDILLRNAERMNIDLSKLTHIVLSHGHNDHTGGLKYLADRFNLTDVELLAHPDCFLPKRDGEEMIGAPFTIGELSTKVHYHPCTAPCYLSENLIYLGEIPRENGFEAREPIGQQQKSGKWEDDYVMDDTALVYQNGDGIFIITGCSHSGICNIIEYARQVCQEQRILGVLGGFHLLDDDGSSDRVRKTLWYLESCGIGCLYPCHCVSLPVKAKLLEHLPVTEVGVGMTVTIE